MSTKIQYKGNKVNRAAIRAMMTAPGSGVSRDLQRRADRVEQAARQLCPVRTGRLKSTIRQVHGSNQRGAYVHVVAGDHRTPYLEWVLNGARAHMIYPKSKKVLRFKPIGSSTFVFAKKVRHPGQKARDFLRAALRVAT